MSFIARLRTRARELKAEVLVLYYAARHPRTPWYSKAFLFAIVAYALSPIDLIPDFIPVLGFVDEIILLPIAIALALRTIPKTVIFECRERAFNRAAINTAAGRVAAIVIVLLWVAAAVAAGLWVYRKTGSGT